MEYFPKNGQIVLYQPDFNLAETLDCGQAFRWISMDGGNSFSGFARNRPLTIKNADQTGTFLLNTSMEDFEQFWVDYFDLKRDYLALKQLYASDNTLNSACSYAPGIRLLRQDTWEALCSFIISQNNNIPRIRKILTSIVGILGHFPDPQELLSFTDEDFAVIRAGFRQKYLLDAARKVLEQQVDLELLHSMPIDDARNMLKTICGVGPKVAECTLLYGAGRVECFPVDVWIKRVLETYYPEGFPQNFSLTAGIAQQFLFHYIRSLPKSVE